MSASVESVSGRVRLIAALGAVALGAAAFAIAFRASLAFAYQHLYGARNVVEAIERLSWPLRVAVPVGGALVAGTIARLRAGTRQGVSNVMEAVALGDVRLSLSATSLRVLSSWAAIATGLSIGREGPLIEFGGALGATMGRLARAPIVHVRVLVAAGTAAGFAAAYNTPIAAVLFVLETIVGIAALDALLPSIAATVAAAALTRAAVGGGPIYGQRAFALGSAWELVSFAALGVLGAAVALAFKSVLGWFERALDRHPIPQPWRAAVGGLVVGVIAIWIPQVVGNGYEPLNVLLDRRLMATVLIALLAAKIVATSGSVASGVPGGIFTPMLLAGGITGALWADALRPLWGEPLLGSGGYTLVGMAATTAASIHAPLTAAVLVFELSGDYAIVLPLLLATTISTTLARALGEDSIYQAELKRRGRGWQLTLEGRQMADDV